MCTCTHCLSLVWLFISLQVVGYKLTGVVSSYATSTDVVLTITKVIHIYTCVGANYVPVAESV